MTGLPDADDLWFFSGYLDLGLSEEAADVCDCPNGSGYEPRQTHHRADEDHEGQNEQVEVIAVTFL